MFLGEPIPSRLVARVLPMLPANCQYVNFGGATEGTVAQIFHTVTEDDAHSPSGTVPLGRPMPSFRCYVLDNFLQPVPLGYTGELYIAGPIMNGYLNRPELNAQVLIQLPGELGKSYKTGDLARVIPSSGELQMLGRKDSQVKLRGQRVEVGEIEAVIHKCSSIVFNCAVIKVTELDQEHLVAYVQLVATVEEQTFDEIQIRTRIQAHLPLWMVPSLFIKIDRLPTNSNGKLDRAALPKPDLSSLFCLVNTSNENLDDEPIMTSEQRRVHGLWCHVLHLDSNTRISADRSFFSLGGNSLAMMRLYVEYQASFNHDSRLSMLSIATLFHQSTIAEHALILQKFLCDPSEEEQGEENLQERQLWSSLNIDQGNIHLYTIPNNFLRNETR